MRFGLALALLALATYLLPLSAQAAPTMCGEQPPRRTLMVSIDPDLSAVGLTRFDVLAAMQRWNGLWQKYHGFPAFAEHFGNWQDADILLTAHSGQATTWVATPCLSSFEVRGQNRAVIHLGPVDGWRNAEQIAHELGHTLGLPDWVPPGFSLANYSGPLTCGNYIGVISYCTSPQSWFLDQESPYITTDGQLIRDFYGKTY